MSFQSLPLSAIVIESCPNISFGGILAYIRLTNVGLVVPRAIVSRFLSLSPPKNKYWERESDYLDYFAQLFLALVTNEDFVVVSGTVFSLSISLPADPLTSLLDSWFSPHRIGAFHWGDCELWFGKHGRCEAGGLG